MTLLVSTCCGVRSVGLSSLLLLLLLSDSCLLSQHPDDREPDEPGPSDASGDNDVCQTHEQCDSEFESFANNELDGHRYLLYDADRSEGFNLRRDVYIRMAELTLDLGSNWTLVLPPWTRMPHWTKRKDTEVRTKRPLSWSTFFNVHALQEVVPVIEFDTFIDHVANQIDLVLVLNQFDDVFSTSDITSEEASSTSFDRFEPTECDAMHNVPYEKHRDAEGLDHVHGSFYGFFSQSVRAARLACARMDGTTRTLRKAILERYLDAHTLFIHNAHVPLHAQYGDARFWLIRRSMQFSERVLRYADEFRLQHFDSDDSRDKTFIGDDWILEKTKRERKPGDALGGEYVAVHLRRGDFKKATDAVSVSDAIAQSFVALRKFNATKLFVACDCDADDWQQLQRQFEQSKKAENQIYELFRYQNDRLSDGELAIVDQWICAHAKAFIGSIDSTFSFRIQEEREIFGFHHNTTFNAFCAKFSGDQLCEQSIKWKIVYTQQS